MDHDQIEERSLAERYVAGTLSSEERDRFEEHLVDCSRCLDRIDEAERIRAGLAAIDDERPVSLLPRTGPAVRARARLRPLALSLAAGLVIGVLPFLLLLRTAQRDRGSLAGARAAAEARATTAERSLAEERRARMSAEAALADAEQAAELPVLALASTRGGDDGPGPTLQVPPGAPFVVLAIETSGFAAYGAQLLGPDGQVRWRADRLAATSFGVAVALPARLLLPGAYRVVLEGLTGERRTAAGRYAFRIAAAPPR